MTDLNKIGFGIMMGSLLCMLLISIFQFITNGNGVELLILCIPVVIGAILYEKKPKSSKVNGN